MDPQIVMPNLAEVDQLLRIAASWAAEAANLEEPEPEEREALSSLSIAYSSLAAVTMNREATSHTWTTMIEAAHAAALPAGLDFPDREGFGKLPDGGWLALGDDAHGPSARLAFGGGEGCSAQLRAPSRDDETPFWTCTRHINGWHIAVGIDVVAVWRLPDGGDR